MTVLLPHSFNHQTRHRGRIGAMPRQTGCPYPELDMHRVMLPAPGWQDRAGGAGRPDILS